MMGLRATTAPHDGVDSAFTQGHAEQVVHLRGQAFVTQMLRLFVIHHGGFQTRPKTARRFQSLRRRTALHGVTVGAFDFVNLRLDHQRAHHRQFGQLMAYDADGFAVAQIGLAMGAVFGFDFNDAIRFFYQRTRCGYVTGFGTDPLGYFGGDEIGLLIARWRLRGVAGSNRRRSRRQLRCQFRHPRFQRRDVCVQGFDQRDQFGARQLLKLYITNNHRIQRPCGSVKINLLANVRRRCARKRYKKLNRITQNREQLPLDDTRRFYF